MPAIERPGRATTASGRWTSAAIAQADKLVELLAPFEIDAIYSSPYRRCAQTVGPLARSRGPSPSRTVTSSVRPSAHERGAEFVRSLARRHVVVCGHGGLESLVLGDAPRWRKGETLVLDERLRVVESLR